jgi:hypothetical protein
MHMNDILDGTEKGQMKVRVFSFLNRLDTSRGMDPKKLSECVARVFRLENPEGLIAEWVRLRRNESA